MISNEELELYLTGRGWVSCGSGMYKKESITFGIIKLLEDCVVLCIHNKNGLIDIGSIYYKDLRLDISNDKLYISSIELVV